MGVKRRILAAAAVAGAAALLPWAVLHGRRDGPGWENIEGARYAHRGLHGPGAPENSMAAFRRAAEAGYGAELDVHLTRDGRLAVIHDADLTRMCGVPGLVEEQTAEELSAAAVTRGIEDPAPKTSAVFLRLSPVDLAGMAAGLVLLALSFVVQ